MAQTLMDQKDSGKFLMLITNSDYEYTNQMMTYAYDRFLPEGTTWRDLFDMVGGWAGCGLWAVGCQIACCALHPLGCVAPGGDQGPGRGPGSAADRSACQGPAYTASHETTVRRSGAMVILLHGSSAPKLVLTHGCRPAPCLCALHNPWPPNPSSTPCFPSTYHTPHTPL